MCGRYSLFVAPETLKSRFSIDVSAYEPRYNAAPSQSLPVISDGHPSSLSRMEWGFVPPWADERNGHINARGESLRERPTFAAAFEGNNYQASSGEVLKTGRCLVPADGFYEWVQREGKKQPYRVQRTDGEPFAMAGLWTQWRPKTTQMGLDAFGGDTTATARETTDSITTFAIVTTEPNDVVQPLHHRMAVILPEGEERRWLTESPTAVEPLLAPYGGELESYPVSTAVNNPKNDSPAVIKRVEV